jgi:hypothetical protein
MAEAKKSLTYQRHIAGNNTKVLGAGGPSTLAPQGERKGGTGVSREHLPHADPDDEIAQILRYDGNGHSEYAVDCFLDFLKIAVREEGPEFVHDLRVQMFCRTIREHHPRLYRKITTYLRTVKGVWVPDFEAMLDLLPSTRQGKPRPQSSTALMAKTFEPPIMYVEHLLPHGMTLLAGRKKKGKSTLSLDLALAIAAGRMAFRKLRTTQTRVLYVSLEDNDELIHERLQKIQPNFTGHPNLDFLYEFPRLDTPEALEDFHDFITEGYQVIFVDVLGRVLPKGNKVRKSYDEYALMTDVLGPLQTLANTSRIALIFLDHVRKASGDDLFDTIQGSGAKWGVADHGMIYERRFRETDAVLQLSSRRLGDNTLRLALLDGHLEFLGMGEEYEANQEESRVIRVLSEEKRPMDLRSLMSAIDLPQTQYGRFRTLMYRLYGKGLVGRTKKGLYTVGMYEESVDDVPF